MKMLPFVLSSVTPLNSQARTRTLRKGQNLVQSSGTVQPVTRLFYKIEIACSVWECSVWENELRELIIFNLHLISTTPFQLVSFSPSFLFSALIKCLHPMGQ